MANVQRAFTQKLSKAHCADVRRNVSVNAPKSSFHSYYGNNLANEVLEPYDYEEFLTQYQSLIDGDPLKGILDVPTGDINVQLLERPIRTLSHVLPTENLNTLLPHVQACIEKYTSDWIVVCHRERFLSSSYSNRSDNNLNLPQTLSCQEFEVDIQQSSESSQIDSTLSISSSNSRQSVASIASSTISTTPTSATETLTPRNSWASLDLRYLAGDELITDIFATQSSPEHVEQHSGSRRQSVRQESLMSLYSQNTLEMNEPPVERRLPATHPVEHIGHRILVKCLQLSMDLDIEPIFASMALYDSKERKKVSETFYFDMNGESIKRMLNDHIPYSDISTLSRACIFNITQPSTDLFLVIRLEKVLQGDISECVDPYTKDDKNREKLRANAVSTCERLGKYRQAFAWTAIYLMNVIDGGSAMDRDKDERDSVSSAANTNSLDRKVSAYGLDPLRRKGADISSLSRRSSLERRSDKRRSWSQDHLANNFDCFRPVTLNVTTLFRQEADRLRDEDLYKCLADLKRPNLMVKKLKCIPCMLKLEISPCGLGEIKGCLTTELSKIYPYPDDKGRPIKELLEFPIRDPCVTNYTFRNLLFVSPKELNFSNRAGSARNLAVKVQLMENEIECEALENIFGRSSCQEMCKEAYCAVSYHNRCPSYYDEMKIKIPASLASGHHLLFTFYHISCQRKPDAIGPINTPVGYTWLPLLREGRLVSGEFCLPVMLDKLPENYSYIPADVYLPGTKWLDNHKGVFTVCIDTASSVHSHDPAIERFFASYDIVQSGVVPTRLAEGSMENEIRAATLGLQGAKAETIVKYLPVVLDCIIELLVKPPKFGGNVLNIGHTLFESMCLILENVSNLQDLPLDQHGRNTLLSTYIQYQCHLPHPLAASGNSAATWGGHTMSRSSSNPDIELINYIPTKGVDRAASMRIPSSSTSAGVDVDDTNQSTRIVHRELALQWVVASGRARTLAMKHAWFFFDLIARSMVLHLYHSSTLDSSSGLQRRLRFSSPFLDDVVSLTQNVTVEIIASATGDFRNAHRLNAALSFFIFDLFSIMDRGFVMQLVRNYTKQMQAKINSLQDAGTLVELKLESVRIMCSHEHYIPFNLPFGTPFMTTRSKSISPSPSVTSTTSQNSNVSGSGTATGSGSQERTGMYADLTVEYRQHHYLTGLLLADLAIVLLEMPQASLHAKAVDTVRSLLVWHDSDPRYTSPEARKRITALYLPLLAVAMDALPLLHNFGDNDHLIESKVLGSSSTHQQAPNISQTVAQAIAGVLTTPASCEELLSNRKPTIGAEVTRNLLVCVLWVLKNIDQDSLLQWLNEMSAGKMATLLYLLDACSACFEYRPRKSTIPPSGYAHAQMSTHYIKSRLEDVILGQGSAREMMQRRKGTEKLRWRKEQMSYRSSTDEHHHHPSSSASSNLNITTTGSNLESHSNLDGYLATEASFIVLDTLEQCVFTVAQWDSQQTAQLVGLALTVLLHALEKNQSTTVLPHMFASQRNLVCKFHNALFDDETDHCANLCLMLLKHCGSQIASVRSQAAASLYLLMRQTFQIGNNFARVKIQVTMSLSCLVGTMASFSDESLRRSLKTIHEYGEKDAELQDTTFPEQVRDLVFNLHMILSDTVKMKEFQEDPEMLLDLMYRIAKGYQNSPDLRLTWLANMAQKHLEKGNHCEAGMCLIHSAALVAEYLTMIEPSPYLPAGAAAFERVSPNVLEESAVSDDVLSPDTDGNNAPNTAGAGSTSGNNANKGGCLGFTEGGLVGLLEHAASNLHIAGMYEPINDIYRVLLPIAENNRDFTKLANIHGKLRDAYILIDKLHGKRVFGTYFRVGFYGTKFGDLDNQEFIYKEPTLTKLPEIFNRLENFYTNLFGSDSVVIIKDSNIVDISKLDADKAYIQITYVEPYFERYELRTRQTHFDQNFNIKRFMYATPFTPSGRAHGELHEQYKQKTILTTAVHFPYVKTRIEIVDRTQITLTPIEVAIEDIQKKTAELNASTTQEPPDPKILQMVLQGSIGTTVNQGPLEMATTFLKADGKTLTRHQNKLRLCFKDFSKKCHDALKRNKHLIGPDQKDYQRELERNYKRFTDRLKPLVNLHNITIVNNSPNRNRNTDASLKW